MQLKEWIEKENKTIKDISEDLEVSEMNVYRWCAGTVIPRPDMMAKIVEYTGGEVQPNDFYKGE